MHQARLLNPALAAVTAAALLFAILPTPAGAVPGLPYCPGSAAVAGIPGATLPVDPSICEQATGRVFPEAIQRTEYLQPDASGHSNTGFAQDFVSYYEFQAGLAYLASQFPDYIEVHEVAMSVGHCITPDCGSRASVPVYMLEITNEKSPMPLEERQSLLFMLSIHGVEKGGREGGFRVLEDLLKGIGFASETVQNGAGLPEPIAKPTSGNVATYRDYLDFMRVFLLFPNPDGWLHDELPFVVSGGTCGGNGVLFCRTNANGVDLNRQAPTLGWQDPSRVPVGEPEAIGYYNWMLTNDIDWAYAIDIHGMLSHQNFVAIMLPAGSMTPQEMQRSLRLSETLKERLNDNPHFDTWRQAFATAGTAEDAAHPVLDGAGLCNVGVPIPLVGGAPVCSPSSVAGSDVFAEYYTVIDAIGYTDSGFNGDYFAQDNGLNAPGYDIELAYNHMTVDSAYPGVGAQLNDYHVKSVREIVKSFMDAAALDVQISFETGGLRTLYLEPTFVATNLDDEKPTPSGAAAENDGDDIWDYGLDSPFFARPAKYWDDLRPFVRHGDEPGVLVKTTASGVTRAKLDGFDTFVIPGSAIKEIEADAGAIADVRAWVEAGGTLVLTDEGLRFFDLSGITEDAVASETRYMGGIRMDLTHPLLAKVRGGVKQTYEPTPLGFEVGANAAPNWFLDPAAFAEIEGEVAGLECGGPQLTQDCSGNGVALGQVSVGQGQVRFVGALLPDPTEEFYHPYGLDHYATTYSGNQVLRNLLGWDERFQSPPIVISDTGEIVQSENEPEGTGSNDTPATEDPGEESPGPASGLLLLAVLAAALVALRRRSA